MLTEDIATLSSPHRRCVNLLCLIVSVNHLPVDIRNLFCLSPLLAPQFLPYACYFDNPSLLAVATVLLEVLYNMLSGVQKYKEILPIATAIYGMPLAMVFYERNCGRQRKVMFLSYNVVLPVEMST